MNSTSVDLLVYLYTYYLYCMQALGTSYRVATRALINLSQDVKRPRAINFLLATDISQLATRENTALYEALGGYIRSPLEPTPSFPAHIRLHENRLSWAAY